MKTIKIKSCLDCPNHGWKWNPDPTDWFRDDESDLICKKKKNKKIASSLNAFEKQNPKLAKIPKWCPL